MDKYGIGSTNSCVESNKDLKKRIKMQKMKLNDFIEIADGVDMNWEHKNQMAGSLYLELVRMEKRLKETK